MTIKLTLQIVEPYDSGPSETWCPPELIPSVPVMDAAFFEDFLYSEFPEEIGEFCNLEFDDFSELFSSVHFVPKARYYLADSYDTYRKLALEKARELAQKYRMIYIFTNADDNTELYRTDFDLASYVEDVVNSREDDCQSSIDVGEAMIKGMEKYVASASWHYDLISEDEKKKPVMWFGLDGEKPEEGWILNIEDNPDSGTSWKSFWFADDQWENRVPDADSVFLIWVETECDLYLPSLEDVLKTCPIDVNEQDDYEALTRKITNLIQERDKKDP